MSENECQRVLVLGGAGFVGSQISRSLTESGHRVTVIDGLLPRTGADPRNLAPLSTRIEFIRERVEDLPDLPAFLAAADTIVDCMGWTCHLLALRDPFYDAELNLRSHLTFLKSLPAEGGPRLIYIGSRGQYGRPNCDVITEDCRLEPVDIQGIHKVAAEHYIRFFAARAKVPAVSLRLPACIGLNQPVRGEDIGLFGGFCRDLLQGRTITVYGSNRRRAVVDADDVAGIVNRVVSSHFRGFEAYNVPGHSVSLDVAATRLKAMIGSGEVCHAPLPGEIARIDVGDAEADCAKITGLIGEISLTSLDDMFATMVARFREGLS